MLWALEATDAHIALIIKAYEEVGLRDQLHVIVHSDHGFSPVRWRIDAGRLLAQQNIDVHVVPNGYVAYLHGSEAELDKAERVLRGHEKAFVERVFRPGEYHALGLPLPSESAMIGQRIVLSRPHAYFKLTTNNAVVQDLKHAGMHGHLPAAAGNQATLIVAGPRIRPASPLKNARLVDIAPTAATLLGLTMPAPLEGHVLKQILR